MIATDHQLSRRTMPSASIVTMGLSLLDHGNADASRSQADNIEQMMQRFLVPSSNHDVAGFSPFFAEDATVFFPGRPTGRVQGQAEIARAFVDLFGPPISPPGSARVIQPQELLIQRFDGFAIVTFHLGSDASRGRRTFVLRRLGSEWKIAHLHASTLTSSSGT